MNELKSYSIYEAIFKALSNSNNPFDIYTDTRAYYGYEIAIIDAKQIIVNLQTEASIHEK